MIVVEWILSFFREFLALTNEMAPYLLLGFLIAGLLKVLFPRRIITRYMGTSSFGSLLNASLLGVPLPLCSCGVLPTGIGFYKSGASKGSTVSFLISTPQTGVDSILATYAMMGLPMAIIRPIIALVSGVFGGWLTKLSERREQAPRPVEHVEETQQQGFRAIFDYGFVELVQDISKWLIIGMLAAALLAVLIPADFFVQQIHNEALAMGIMLLASVPLYICATGSIPIAAVLMLKGLSPGAALVLLMAGPATNIATMAVIGNTMGKRTLWAYLISIIGGALLFGTLVNEFIPREWITGALPLSMGHAFHDHGQAWWKWASSALLLILIVHAFLRKRIGERKRREADLLKSDRMSGQVQNFRVEGMSCKNCKDKVERGFAEMDAVKGVVADPDKNLLSLDAAQISEEEVRMAVEGMGYTFKGRIFLI